MMRFRSLTSLAVILFVSWGAILPGEELPNQESTFYGGILYGRTYSEPGALFEEVKALKSPWDHIFTIAFEDQLKHPDPEKWEQLKPIDLGNKLRIAAYTGAIQGEYGGSAATNAVTVIFLMKKLENNGLEILDYLIRRRGAYNGITLQKLEGITTIPQLHIDSYNGGRRDGENTHEIFTISQLDDRHTFKKSLEFKSLYSQNGRNEECRVYVANQLLDVQVNIRKDAKDDSPWIAKLDLPWDPATLRYSDAPLAGILDSIPASKTARHDWDIIPGKRVGPITDQSDFEELLASFGKENVLAGEISVGEGEMEKGAIVYQGTPNELKILFDPSGKARDIRISKEKTSWKTPHGITIGSSLADVEAANGKPFIVSTFEWDYGGMIESYEKGNLPPSFLLHFGFDDVEKYSRFSLEDWSGHSQNQKLRDAGLKVQKIWLLFKNPGTITR